MRMFAVLLSVMIWLGLSDVPRALAQADPPASGPAHQTRMTWQQRFDKANTTGDGRLTLEQAQAGYPTIARHFQEIDQAGRGYVTREDIKAWRKAKREARSLARARSDDPLRPRPAMQRGFADQRQVSTNDVTEPQAPPETSPGTRDREQNEP